MGIRQGVAVAIAVCACLAGAAIAVGRPSDAGTAPAAPAGTAPPAAPAATAPAATAPAATPSGRATVGFVTSSTKSVGTPVAMVPLYPWGTDHNGTARMYAGQVATADGVTTLTAIRDLRQHPPLSDHKDNGINPPIHYRSGAVHSASPLTVGARKLRISVEAQLPSQRGTWPAIWLSGADSWPPEIDLVEILGSTRVLQNVFATTRRNSQHVTTEVPDPWAWHTYAADLVPDGTGGLTVHFSIDGRPTGALIAEDLVGKRFWIVANLQTERWSGTPGPERSVMRFRNLVVS